MRKLLILLTLPLFIVCNGITKPEHSFYDDLQKGSIDNFSSDEKQIINLLISESCGQIALISDSTKIGPIDTNRMFNSDTFPLPLLKKCNEINQKKFYIGNINLGISHDYRYFDSKYSESVFTGDPNGGWNTFYKRFPLSHGFLSFSKIAFSEDSTKAIVNVSKFYGSLGADGGFASFVKVNGIWKKLSYEMIWIS